MSDSEFPKELNSAEEQIKRAKELATQHVGIPAETAKLTEIQGCFSKTVEVSLKDDRDIIIQFRIEPLDTEPFARARSLLGDKVPIIESIDDPKLVEAGIWPFYMTRIPRKTWLEYENEWSDTQHIKCAKSLGNLFVVVSVLAIVTMWLIVLLSRTFISFWHWREMI
jgi:hypothetical protein